MKQMERMLSNFALRLPQHGPQSRKSAGGLDYLGPNRTAVARCERELYSFLTQLPNSRGMDEWKKEGVLGDSSPNEQKRREGLGDSSPNMKGEGKSVYVDRMVRPPGFEPRVQNALFFSALNQAQLRILLDCSYKSFDRSSL
jgi:hypothetical protein